MAGLDDPLVRLELDYVKERVDRAASRPRDRHRSLALPDEGDNRASSLEEWVAWYVLLAQGDEYEAGLDLDELRADRDRRIAQLGIDDDKGLLGLTDRHLEVIVETVQQGRA